MLRRQSHPYDLIKFTAPQLWGLPAARGVNGAFILPVPGNGAVAYEAFSIDPQSQFRTLLAYFDQDTVATPVLPGEVVKRSYGSVRIETMFDVAHNGGNVPGAGLGFGNDPPICPQIGYVRCWAKAPSFDQFFFPRYMSVTQELLATGANSAITAGNIMFIHAPGAEIVTLWGSNEAHVNAGALVIQLLPLRSERPTSGSKAPFNASQFLLGTGGPNITVPAASDGFFGAIAPAINNFETGAVEVPCSDWAVGQTGNVAVGSYQLMVGVNVFFREYC
jgi:hypothetical protein